MKPHKKHTPQNRPRKSLLIAGIPQVIASMKNGVHLERIYLQNNMAGTGSEELKTLALEFGVPVNKVPYEKIKGFNLEDPHGCVAVKSVIRYQNLQDVISFVVEQGETPLFLVFDGITDIRNIGAMARTAYCCGAQAIIIPEKGVGSLNQDAIDTSAGALEHLTVCRVKSLPEAIEEMHLNGIKVFASEMKAGEMIFNTDFTEPCAVILGSEDKGVHPSLYRLCDGSFKIPMQGDFESLNVSVAAGMILYEAMKQRLSQGKK